MSSSTEADCSSERSCSPLPACKQQRKIVLTSSQAKEVSGLGPSFPVTTDDDFFCRSTRSGRWPKLRRRDRQPEDASRRVRGRRLSGRGTASAPRRCGTSGIAGHGRRRRSRSGQTRCVVSSSVLKTFVCRKKLFVVLPLSQASRRTLISVPLCKEKSGKSHSGAAGGETLHRSPSGACCGPRRISSHPLTMEAPYSCLAGPKWVPHIMSTWTGTAPALLSPLQSSTCCRLW